MKTFLMSVLAYTLATAFAFWHHLTPVSRGKKKKAKKKSVTYGGMSY